jgi:hypothetical protein
MTFPPGRDFSVIPHVCHEKPRFNFVNVSGIWPWVQVFAVGMKGTKMRNSPPIYTDDDKRYSMPTIDEWRQNVAQGVSLG